MSEDKIIRQLIHWGEKEASIRALILTSTRANPNAPTDLFSDYDVVVVVTDIQPYFEDRSWLETFGKVLVLYRDPIKPRYGIGKFNYITQYEDRTKIDFIVWPVELQQKLVADPKLPDDFDIGYSVLLDKDGLTVGMKPPTYAAFIPPPPTEAAFRNIIEEFFHETTYVGKNLWRDELLPAKFSFDHVMKQSYLRKMLEWRIEMDHDWSLKTGASGKGLKKQLPEEIWSELEATYTGAQIENNWEALFRTIALFRKVALRVADHLGHSYLHDLDQRVVAYLQEVEQLDPK